MFDTRYKFTAKELDNETSYTYFGARYYDSELSGWLSVDPMSDKYPSLSPYCYTADNPVILVDPLGDTIKLAENQSEEFISAYNKAIDELKSTNRGLELYNNLQNSEQLFIVREHRGESEKRNTSFFEPNDINVINLETGESKIINQGGEIVWKIDGTLIPVQKSPYSIMSKLEMSGNFSLFHEMAHAEDQHYSKLYDYKNNYWRGLSIAEWSATHTENQIRSQLNRPLRTHYYSSENGNSVYPSLLKSDSNGIKSAYFDNFYYIKF